MPQKKIIESQTQQKAADRQAMDNIGGYQIRNKEKQKRRQQQ